MQKPLIALIQQTPAGPQVTQQGKIEETIGEGYYAVSLQNPAPHKRVMHASMLTNFTIFDTPIDFANFIDVIFKKANPNPPSDPPNIDVPEEQSKPDVEEVPAAAQ